MIYGDSPTYGWLGGSVGVWVLSCQISKNGIKLGLIEITQVYLKIYDLWRLHHLWVDVWVGGHMGGAMSTY